MKMNWKRWTLLHAAVVGVLLSLAATATYHSLTIDGSGWCVNSQTPIFATAKASVALHTNAIATYTAVAGVGISPSLLVDTINENTSDNGVDIESVHLENGDVTATAFHGSGAALTGITAGMWTLVQRQTLTSPATSVTFSSLNGNTDRRYKVVLRWLNGYDGEVLLYLRPNNDAGATYLGQSLTASDTSVSGAAYTASTIGSASVLSNVTFVTAELDAVSGRTRQAMSQMSFAEARISFYGVQWANTADNITSLVVTASQANGIGNTTVVELWKLSQ